MPVSKRRRQQVDHEAVAGALADVGQRVDRLGAVAQGLSRRHDLLPFLQRDFQRALGQRKAFEAPRPVGLGDEARSRLRFKLVPLHRGQHAHQPQNPQREAAVLAGHRRGGVALELLEGRGGLVGGQQILQRVIQRLGDAPDGRERGVALVALDLREDRLGDAGFRGQLFQREAVGAAQALDLVAYLGGLEALLLVNLRHSEIFNILNISLTIGTR